MPPSAGPAENENAVSSPAPAQGGAAGDKPSGPRSRKGVETRARLLAAAKEVFEQDGFLDARISDIAERAGLSHGSFYHYFESKEEVFREVAAEVEQRLSEPLYSVILDSHSTASPYERIHEGIRRNFESYRDEARIMGVIEQVSRFDDTLRAVPQRAPPRLVGADRRLHPPPAATRAGRPAPRPSHRRGRPGGHDLPLPRDVVRPGPAGLRLRPRRGAADPALRQRVGLPEPAADGRPPAEQAEDLVAD